MTSPTRSSTFTITSLTSPDWPSTAGATPSLPPPSAPPPLPLEAQGVDERRTAPSSPSASFLAGEPLAGPVVELVAPCGPPPSPPSTLAPEEAQGCSFCPSSLPLVLLRPGSSAGPPNAARRTPAVFPVVHAIGLEAACLSPGTAVVGETPQPPPPPTPASEAAVVVAGEVVAGPDHFASVAASKPAGVRVGVDGCGKSLVDADAETVLLPPSSTVANDGAPPPLLPPQTEVAASLAAGVCAFGPLTDTDFRRGEMADAASPEPPRTMSANEDDLARAWCGSFAWLTAGAAVAAAAARMGWCPFSRAYSLCPRLGHGFGSSPASLGHPPPPPSTSLSLRFLAVAVARGQAPVPAAGPMLSRLSRRELDGFDQPPPVSSSRRSRAEPLLPHARLSSTLPPSCREAPLNQDAPPPSSSCRISPLNVEPLLPLEGASALSR